MIDLTEGSGASEHPVEYLSFVDVNESQHKTQKLVLRQVPDSDWMSGYEITQGQYELVTGTNPSYYKPYPSRPVERLSLSTVNSSTGFIQLLRDRTSLASLSLPSESQWNFCARAGATSDYSDYTANQGLGGTSETNLGGGGHLALTVPPFADRISYIV